MSIDLNWEALTTGPDGEALADRIKDFIHDKFQTVQLPRFIKSVNVHGFHFGSMPPELELKDVTDPLPDFYEQDDDDEDDEDEDAAENTKRDGEVSRTWGKNPEQDAAAGGRQQVLPQHVHGRNTSRAAQAERDRRRPKALRADLARGEVGLHDLGSPFLGASTPGILGGPGLNYFQGHLGTGTHTPLAAVAGAQAHHLGHYHHHNSGWAGGSRSPELDGAHQQGRHRQLQEGKYASSMASHHKRQASQSSVSVDNLDLTLPQPAMTGGASSTVSTQGPSLREKSSVSTLAPTSVDTSRPPTREAATTYGDSAIVEEDGYYADTPAMASSIVDAAAADLPCENPRARIEPRVDDVQAVFRIRYAGDIRLNLTAEILLDYPMPSFVGIPLKLNITGLSFDGVGVLARIRKRLHFCFLSPEDALAAIGPDDEEDVIDDAQSDQGQQKHMGGAGDSEEGAGAGKRRQAKVGGLLQEIKVESEIGQQESGKQSLKNVGKVERFVLEQVRRIFEEEFVYPSFWTFLV